MNMDTDVNYTLPGNEDFQMMTFNHYLYRIIHSWSKVLSALVFTLVPLFAFLDFFIVPDHLLPEFILLRSIATVFAIVQLIVLMRTKPGRLSYIHGYLAAIIVGVVISLMTVQLGGFDARYYAGLNLIIIAVSLFLPWESYHSAIIGCGVIGIYVFTNYVFGSQFKVANMLSNLFFMSATVIISVSINHVKHNLIKNEFSLIKQLQSAMDALWGEMEIAKKIQTSLLPSRSSLGGYTIASVMLPAEEVGGDYFDIIESIHGEHWVAIGDVSGHGVESGLIMMMTQTSIASMVNNQVGNTPTRLIANVNSVINSNIKRLQSDLYMTLLVLKLDNDSVTFAGKHQDIMIYRAAQQKVETITTAGTWIGLTSNIVSILKDYTIKIEPDDVILLFTDGITEAMDTEGTMYGYESLKESLLKHAEKPVETIIENILKEGLGHLNKQDDDITLLAVKRKS